MSFFSTRGESCVTASQAILHGLAPDGGLYVPAMFPSVPMQRISSFCEMDYVGRAVSILKRYLEDFSIPEIEEAVPHDTGNSRQEGLRKDEAAD